MTRRQGVSFSAWWCAHGAWISATKSVAATGQLPQNLTGPPGRFRPLTRRSSSNRMAGILFNILNNLFQNGQSEGQNDEIAVYSAIQPLYGIYHSSMQPMDCKSRLKWPLATPAVQKCVLSGRSDRRLKKCISRPCRKHTGHA